MFNKYFFLIKKAKQKKQLVKDALAYNFYKIGLTGI
jgi:hypothetical protein